MRAQRLGWQRAHCCLRLSASGHCAPLPARFSRCLKIMLLAGISRSLTMQRSTSLPPSPRYAASRCSSMLWVRVCAGSTWAVLDGLEKLPNPVHASWQVPTALSASDLTLPSRRSAHLPSPCCLTDFRPAAAVCGAARVRRGGAPAGGGAAAVLALPVVRAHPQGGGAQGAAHGAGEDAAGGAAGALALADGMNLHPHNRG